MTIYTIIERIQKSHDQNANGVCQYDCMAHIEGQTCCIEKEEFVTLIRTSFEELLKEVSHDISEMDTFQFEKSDKGWTGDLVLRKEVLSIINSKLK
jgi:hypothetical protein